MKQSQVTTIVTTFCKENPTIVVTIHESTHGPGHDLRDLLVTSKVKRLLFIAHPLLFLPSSYKNSSRFELYEDGKLIQQGSAHHWILPEYLAYIKDTFYTLMWIIKYVRGIDSFFGIGNLNALVGVLLKSVHIAKRTVYYVIDYVPNRFSNPLINTLYHGIEKIAAQYSTYTWNLSERMIIAREAKWHRRFPHQLIVPHGVHLQRIKRVAFGEINKHEILFMGALLKKQGVQLALAVLPSLIKKIPDIHLTVIGRGPYEGELKALVKKNKLEKYTTFLGYIEDHSEMENRMAKAAIALALYDRNEDANDFTYYADPGKIKNYLGAGVPIIMTDVPLIAKQVHGAKCGFMIFYTEKALRETLLNYFSHTDVIKQYRENALAFAKEYDWSIVFAKALAYLGK